MKASVKNIDHIKELKKLANELRDMDGYKDSLSLAGECDQMAETRMEIQYEYLLSIMENAADYYTLIFILERLKELEGYKDSDKLEEELRRMASEIKEKERLEKLEEKYMLVLSAVSKARSSDMINSTQITFLANECKKMDGYKDSGDMERELRRMAAEALEKEEELENELRRKAAEELEKERRRKAAEELEKEKEAEQRERQAAWEEQGLCVMCGGQLGGLLTKKCKSCGAEQRRA